MRKKILSLIAALTVMSAFLSGGGTFVTAFAAEVPVGYELAYKYDFSELKELPEDEITKLEYLSNTKKGDLALVQDEKINGTVLQVDVNESWAGVTFNLGKIIDLPGTYIFDYDIKSGNDTKSLLTTKHDTNSDKIGVEKTQTATNEFTTVKFNEGEAVNITGNEAYFTIQLTKNASNVKFWISSLRIYKTAPDYGNSEEIDSGLKLTFGQNSITVGDLSSGGKITQGRTDGIKSINGNTAELTLPSVDLNSQYDSVVVNLSKPVTKNNPNPVSFEVFVGGTKAAEFKNISTHKYEDGQERWDKYLDFTSPILDEAKSAKGNVVLKISIPSGSYIGNFAYVTFKKDAASVEPANLKDGEAVGGYYTEGDTAAGEGNPKIGIIRFFQQYKGNTNISQYGFYFVGSDGKILDYQNYINDNNSFTEDGFYGDLINAQFNTAYHAKAFVVTTGGQIYFSDTITGRADENNWVKNPNYSKNN